MVFYFFKSLQMKDLLSVSIFQEGKNGEGSSLLPSLETYWRSMGFRRVRAARREPPLSKTKNVEAFPSVLGNKSLKTFKFYKQRVILWYLEILLIAACHGKSGKNCLVQKSDAGCFPGKPTSWVQGDPPFWFLSVCEETQSPKTECPTRAQISP